MTSNEATNRSEVGAVPSTSIIKIADGDEVLYEREITMINTNLVDSASDLQARQKKKKRGKKKRVEQAFEIYRVKT